MQVSVLAAKSTPTMGSARGDEESSGFSVRTQLTYTASTDVEVCTSFVRFDVVN